MEQEAATREPAAPVARSRSKSFGSAVRETRKALGFSQEKAALTCGLDRSFFGKIERGEKSPTLDTIFRIADGLDTTPSELLARTERLDGKS